MPEANSAPILSNLPSRYPSIVPGSAQKPNLLVHNDVRTTVIHNPRVRTIVQAINKVQGISTPIICTPEELMKGEHED